jgi:hypothetical protein
MRHSDTQWASSGDVSIAYRVMGDGPLDVVLIPGFVSHVELMWDVPVFAHLLGRIASFSRMVYSTSGAPVCRIARPACPRSRSGPTTSAP